MLATLMRHDIETRVPEGAGRVAALFGSMQDEVRRALPDAHRRRAFLRAALSGPAARAAQDGDMAGAAELMRRALADDSPSAGQVQYIDARGPADLLTLRAARALAAADVLVCDANAHAEILGLARRDVERLGPQTPERLAALTLKGLRVARLVVDPHWRNEHSALAAAGVDVEVLPIAS
jgi:precorrin-2 dehydrogenase/sirohydrochlorin ferrochelatase